MCECKRLIYVDAKCSDMCTTEYEDITKEGYVPDNLEIGSGDYIDLVYCGKIQGDFPLDNQLIKDSIYLA